VRAVFVVSMLITSTAAMLLNNRDLVSRFAGQRFEIAPENEKLRQQQLNNTLQQIKFERKCTFVDENCAREMCRCRRETRSAVRATPQHHISKNEVFVCLKF
jgi:hypothetical protein